MARDLKLFYWFRLLATSYVWFPVFYLFREMRGLAVGEIFFLAGVFSATVIVVEIPTGAFADRIGRRTSMMVGALSMVASCVIAYFAHSLPVFVVAEVFAAASIALCSGADSAYLYDLLKAGGRTQEYARREGHTSALHLGGSALACLAGGFLGEVGLGLPFIVSGAVALVAFFIALAMSDDAPVARRPADAGDPTEPAVVHLRSYLALMRGAIATVFLRRGLLWIIAFSAVFFMLVRSTDYLYQPHLRDLGFNVARTGQVLAAVFMISAGAALCAHRLRSALGEWMLLWCMLGVLGGSFVLLNQFETRIAALGVLAVIAFCTGLYSPMVKPIINRQVVDSGQRATVLSIESIARRAAAGVFIPIIGLYGHRTAIDICGGAAAVGLLMLLVTGPGRVPAPARQPRLVGNENPE